MVQFHFLPVEGAISQLAESLLGRWSRCVASSASVEEERRIQAGILINCVMQIFYCKANKWFKAHIKFYVSNRTQTFFMLPPDFFTISSSTIDWRQMLIMIAWDHTRSQWNLELSTCFWPPDGVFSPADWWWWPTGGGPCSSDTRTPAPVWPHTWTSCRRWWSRSLRGLADGVKERSTTLSVLVLLKWNSLKSGCCFWWVFFLQRQAAKSGDKSWWNTTEGLTNLIWNAVGEDVRFSPALWRWALIPL